MPGKFDIISYITDFFVKRWPFLKDNPEAVAMIIGVLLGGCIVGVLVRFYYKSTIAGLKGEIRVLERDKDSLKDRNSFLEKEKKEIVESFSLPKSSIEEKDTRLLYLSKEEQENFVRKLSKAGEQKGFIIYYTEKEHGFAQGLEKILSGAGWQMSVVRELSLNDRPVDKGAAIIQREGERDIPGAVILAHFLRQQGIVTHLEKRKLERNQRGSQADIVVYLGEI